MAQIAIGAAISFAIGLASSFAISLLTPAQRIEGQRLNDLSAPKSNWGTQINWCWGTVRVTGNVIWAADIIETVSTKGGGKGLGPKISQTTYSYFGTYAVLLCRGPIFGIKRLWLNSRLVVNLGEDADDATVTNSLKFLSDYVRVYLGTETQMPDPAIQGIEGVENTPAYRGRAYLVFNSLPLEDYANQLPIVSAEVVTVGTIVSSRIRPQKVALSSILTELCLKAQLLPDELDMTEVDTLVTGFWINSVTEAREHLGVLQKSYFFDVIDSGRVLRFIRQRRPGVVQSIPIGKLAGYEGGTRPERFQEKRAQEVELPKRIILTSIDPNVEYREGIQMSPEKAGAWSRNDESLTVAVVFSASEAKTVADKLLFLAWIRRRSFTFTLAFQHGRLEPGDLVTVPFYGADTQVMIAKLTLGANLLVQVEAVSYEEHIFDHTATVLQPYTQSWKAVRNTPYALLKRPIFEFDALTSEDGGTVHRLGLDYTVNLIAGTVTILNGLINNNDVVRANYYAEESGIAGVVSVPGATDLRILDIPKIRAADSDYGVYVFATGGQYWRNATLYGIRNISVTGVFIEQSPEDSVPILTKSTIGVCSNVLGSANAFVTDLKNVLTVELNSGQLESITEMELFQDVNLALVGDEIVRFKEALLVAPKTYELRHLVRGVKGTEWAIATHVINEPFYLLSGYWTQVKGTLNDFKTPLRFKAVTKGQSLDEATVVEKTPVPNRIRPWAPANAVATRNGAGDAVITWTRRDRNGGELPLFATIPQSEASEQYEIDFMSGAVVKRTVLVTTPTTTYTAAMQSADLGAVSSAITVRIYQLSELVGRGYPLEATV